VNGSGGKTTASLTAPTPPIASFSSMEKENVTKQVDVAFLRQKIREWARRFIDGGSVKIKVVTAVKDDFIKKYGIEETRKIMAEIENEVAREMMSEPITIDEVVPIIPIFPQRERKPNKPKQPEKRFKKVARCFYH